MEINIIRIHWMLRLSACSHICGDILKLHFKAKRWPSVWMYAKSFMDEDVMIPPLTIQPLVENSIQHGLKGPGERGKVDILDYREAGLY